MESTDCINDGGCPSQLPDAADRRDRLEERCHAVVERAGGQWGQQGRHLRGVCVESSGRLMNTQGDWIRLCGH